MKKVNIIFIITVLIVFIGGFSKAYLKPSSFNYTENRDSKMIPDFAVNDYLNGAFQNKFEEALADQIPFSQKMKKIVKSINAYPIYIYALNKNEYVLIGNIDVYSYNDYLVYKNYHELFKGKIDTLEKLTIQKMKRYSALSKKYKNINFYSYYIEKDTDYDLENKEKDSIYKVIIDSASDNIKVSLFTINSFDDIRQFYYKTDHHWNYKGSYKGYLELLDLLEIKEKPVKIEKEVCDNTIMTGSKSIRAGVHLLYNEKFCAYKFEELPKHDIYINEKKVEEYGHKTNFYNGKKTEITYGDFYGYDYGLVHFDYHNNSKKNILINSESFDNPIIEILASHYNNTYVIDLRAYEKELKEPFNFDEFVKEKNIDDVLIIGNISFYTAELYDLK